jgi:hypothetical protein
MANTKSGQLTANAVATVSVDNAQRGLDIVNRDMTGEIWVTLDGSTPTVAGDNCYVVLGARYFDTQGTTTATVKLISTQALRYAIEGGN